MLDFYTLQKARLIPVNPALTEAAAISWIDLNHPSEEEEVRIERLLGVEIPTREEMAEIEVSSRLYREVRPSI